MYHNALVAIDGSEISTSVLSEVPKLLDPKGMVTVIQVIEDAALVVAKTAGASLEIAVPIDQGTIDEILASQRALAEADLAAARRELEALGVKHVRTAVCSGLAGPSIVVATHQRHADVVLMGTHGHGGFKRALLGSVADYVLRHLTGTPLLLVRPDDHVSRRSANTQHDLVATR